MRDDDHYIPALGLDRLTPLYDPVMNWFMRDDRLKAHVVEQATIQPGHRVLDLGCGTATLPIRIKQLVPEARVVGLDGDPQVLTIAHKKAVQAAVKLDFVQGMAFHLPFPDNTFDRIVSSLVLHHLTPASKQRTLREVHRVLHPHGELHVLDLGKPHSVFAHLISLVTRNFEETADNIQGRLPTLFRETGFADVIEAAHYLTVVGTLSLFKARKLA
jgi:ubiquinone/menaquinone biosynthesis C-methylase UbiE